jgi:DNA-binding winged helix-turn-helix (wHTH) protein/tetratricopeptide (TPR) repeat protein
VILAFADVEVDLDRYELRRSGRPVPVEPQVFDVLAYLAGNAGRLVSKEELLDSVWGDRFVSESALTSRIKAARRSVGDDGQRQRIIATVHGRGYRLMVPVDERHSVVERREQLAELNRRSPLLERDGVLDELTSAVQAAAAGAGRVACVGGDAGLGKTALIGRFVVDVADRAVVLAAAADDLSTPRPLGPIRDIVEQLPSSLRPSAGRDPRPEDVRAAVEALAAESGRAVVVILEDVHWADDATLDVVRYLARRVRVLPVVLVLTYRVETADVGDPLRRLLGLLRGPEVVRVVLEPLTPAAVASLCAGSPHNANDVYRVTGGNPLFVVELVAAPLDTVPETIRDVVLGRCSLLPEGTLDVLRGLAVVPGRVPRTLAGQLAADDGWSACERAGLLDGSATHVWFRHELVRRAVEETMTPSERVHAHRTVARLLHAQGAEPARIVHHAIAANDVDLVVTVAPVAAVDAQRTGAHRQALEHLNAALEYRDRISAATQTELLTRRAHSLYLLNRFEESFRCGQEAVAVAETVDDSRLLLEALLALGRSALWARGPTLGAAVERRALDIAGDAGDPELRAVAHADMARALGELVTIGSVAQGNRTALEHASHAFRLADDLDRDDLRGYALMYRGAERLALGDDAGAGDIDAAITLLEPVRADLAVRACVNASGASFRAGRLAAAERYIELGFQLSPDTEFFSGEFRLALTRASLRAARGDWGDAIAELRAILTLEVQPGIMAPLARSLLARLLARQGQFADAEQVLAGAESNGHDTEIRVLGPIVIARTELAWLSASDDDLADVARPVLEVATATGNQTIAAELSRYLQRAGFATPPVRSAPEPWASSLRGDWSEAARRWAKRDDRYEQALELLAGESRDARVAALDLLRSLGATGTLDAVRRRRR